MVTLPDMEPLLDEIWGRFPSWLEGSTPRIASGTCWTSNIAAEMREPGNKLGPIASINCSEAKKFLGLGGVRIEDDILITADGCRVLGPPILKSIDDIEQQMKQFREN